MSSSSKAPDSGTNTGDVEYLDIIDVFAFVWKSRFFILVGMLIGIASLWIISNERRPPLFISNIPVTLPNLDSVSKDILADRINRMIATPNAAGLIFDDLLGNAQPAVKYAIESNKWTREEFVKLQSADLSSNLRPLRLTQSDGEYLMEVRFKTSDSGAVLSLSLVGAAERVLDVVRAQIAAKRIEQEHIKASEKIGLYEEITRVQLAELTPAKMEIFKLEAQLATKAGISDLVRSGKDDQVLRIVGLLQNTKKISMEEAASLIGRYNLLNAHISFVKAKYLKTMNDLESALGLLSPSILDQALEARIVTPMVATNTKALERYIASGGIEHYESRRSLFLLVGAIAGALIGLLLNGIWMFLRQNSVRFFRIFRP